ncbi:uncharacterized protein LOC110246043 [Exaiptasia diaphana]|uniref:Uncharacterized protein n=1 Tax=Exaiptasia diaphana TaxID=2652724 RepID=A0A913XQD6_EXADI|nr:uncharacterized protein LOC110246043 [Exaiptasia diaphana]KXJ28670.1 Uncharacterized protein C10orf88-like [Exaiptasia diaphana]
MDLEEIASYWARFHLSFSWDYPEGLDLQAVQQAVFHVVGESDGRSQDQLVVGSVQSAGAGVVLTQPIPVSDNVPCELSFTAHPMSDEFCIKNVVIVSEARNVELYVDGCYAKTARGIMLTIRKGRKVSLFETEFDLSEYVRGKCRCAIKFLSFPQPHAVRIQTIVVKVAKRPAMNSSQAQDVPGIQTGINLIPGSVDLVSVKEFIKTSGKELTPEAEKLLASMEQMQWAQGVQMRQSRPRSRSMDIKADRDDPTPPHRFSVASDGSLLQQAIARARELEEEDQYNRRDHVGSPGNNESLINRLAGLMIDRSNHRENGPIIHNGDIIPNGDRHPEEQAQARWEAYVQTRLQQGHQDMNATSRIRTHSSHSTPSILGHGMHYDEPDRPSPPSPPLGTSSTKVSSAPELGTKTRCVACGCPGCLSVYNSITTNIYSTEERIMAKVEQKVQQLQHHIDSQFDALYQSLQLRQEQLVAHALHGNNLHHQGAVPSRRISANSKVGDTSV